MRARLFSRHFDWWTTHGFEFDESVKTRLALVQQETLMKMFAVRTTVTSLLRHPPSIHIQACVLCSQLACKSGREYRAVEVCELMPSSHTVQLAIKYASRLRLMQLAARLGEVARQKAEEEAEEVEPEVMEEVALEEREHAQKSRSVELNLTQAKILVMTSFC